MSPPATTNTWIELAADAYASNLGVFRRLVGDGVDLSAVVKANAYGHGADLIADLAIRSGADSFCVHALDEALELRSRGRSEDVLIMGHTPRGRLSEVVEANLRQVVVVPEVVAVLGAEARKAGRPARAHLKLETGTCRQGVDEAGLPAMLRAFEENPEVRLEGAYTHFANIEDTTDHTFAHLQLERFRALVARLPGRDRPILHTACTAAALVVPSTVFDMVRLGIGQYGIWPSSETLVSYRADHPDAARSTLRPVLTWKTRISQVKDVPAGAPISYGCTYRTTRPSRIAILPIGYSDGYDRGLSNQAHVLVGGHRAPVRGRVCMNLTMVDVTDVPESSLEDEVVLIGRQGSEEVTADQLAAWAGTIAYEVLARLSPTIPRGVVGEAG